VTVLDEPWWAAGRHLTWTLNNVGWRRWEWRLIGHDGDHATGNQLAIGWGRTRKAAAAEGEWHYRLYLEARLHAD
jgi:hypothetical protein